jgi:hypothetical protein|tara:strand:- start:360 stop:581 length:222 start_codon:yes stop_codon:yes gene_type:complete
MANKFTFEGDAPSSPDFKDRQIKLEKSVKQYEYFSVKQLESQLAQCDTAIADQEARKVDIQAKIDAATAALSD